MSFNVSRDHLLSPIESVEVLRRTRLNPFYCTRCGTYHDVITPCPRFEDDIQNKNSYYYQMYNVDTTSRKPLKKFFEDCRVELPTTENDTQPDELSLYDNCQIVTPCNYCLPNTSKCVTFNLENSFENEQPSNENEQPCKPCIKYVQDKCINVASNTDLCDTELENKCDTNLKTLSNVTQGTETVLTNEKGTDSFDNDCTLFEHFGWCNFHERLHGAGFSYPYDSILLPAITEIEETQLLEEKAPGPWTKEGKTYHKRILKLTYPQHNLEYHKKCKGKYGNKKPVPAWMGWLWNATDECMMGGKYKYPVRPDWRPGAMNYKIARMIKRHRGGYEEIEKPKRKPKKRKREEDEDIRPMIVIMKRQGCYLITMNPIFNPFLPSDQNLECAPIHFIVDQRKCQIERVKPKPKCDCNCECDENFEESGENMASSYTSDEENDDEDEFELEFTPPICLVDHETLMKKKHPRADTGTQTEPMALAVKIVKSKSSVKKGKGKSGKAKK